MCHEGNILSRSVLNTDVKPYKTEDSESDAMVNKTKTTLERNQKERLSPRKVGKTNKKDH